MPDLPVEFHALVRERDMRRSPAYLVTDQAGRVVNCEGDLARYGLKNIRPGQSASRSAPFLEGLLDTCDSVVQLHSVQIQNFCVADVCILTKQGCSWVLFLDATVKTKNRQQRQQAAYDAYFSRTDRRSTKRAASEEGGK